MTTHEIKCINPFFNDVIKGLKSFEIRKFDRDYKVGDTVILKEYIPETNSFTGKTYPTRITYLISGTVCLKKGYCAFGIEKPLTKLQLLYWRFRFYIEVKYQKLRSKIRDLAWKWFKIP